LLTGAVYLILIIGLISVFQLFIDRKWKCIYTAYGSEDYYRVVGKLKSKGVKFKTKIPMNARLFRYNDNTQYDIYVKKEFEDKALNALFN
jgi:hypothetical protein